MDRRITSFSLIVGMLIAAGAAGSLACGQATLKELTPAGAATPDFTWRTGVVPIFSSSECDQGACHSQAAKQGGLVLDHTIPASQLYTLVVTSGGNIQKAGQGYEADQTTPKNSLLVLKPTGAYSPGGHGGGTLFSDQSDEYKTILGWVQAGAQND